MAGSAEYVDFFVELEADGAPKHVKSAGIPEELKNIYWSNTSPVALPNGKVFYHCRVPDVDFEKIQQHTFFEGRIVGKSWNELWSRPYEYRDHVFFVSVDQGRRGKAPESQIEPRRIPIANVSHTDAVLEAVARPYGIFAGDDVPEFSILPDMLPSVGEIIRRIEAGVQLRFGDPIELAQRKVVVERITALQQALEGLRPAYGGIGHNKPPPDNDLAAKKSTEIAEAANNINIEISKPEPDALAVGRSAQVLYGVLEWAAVKANMALDEFLKKLAGGVGLATAVGLTQYWAEVLQFVQSVVSASTKWLSSITPPF